MGSYWEFLQQVPRYLEAAASGGTGALTAIFLVLFLGEMGMPFPAIFQGVLLYAGLHIAQGDAQVVPLLLVTHVARQSGGGLVYALSRFLGTRFTRHYRPLVEFARSRMRTSILRPRLPASLAVTLGRLAPGFLVPVSVISGTTRARYGSFALGVLLSAIVWDAIFIGLGAVMGKHVEQYSKIIAVLLTLAVIAGIVVGLFAMARFVHRALKYRASVQA